MNRSLLAAALLACMLPATAATPAKSGKAQASGDSLICTREASTGSHLRKRSCTTRAQREERRAQDREAAQRLREQPKALDSGNR